MGRDYADALEELDGPVHVLGLSMGSMIAQFLAADSPKQVRSLILSMGPPRAVPANVKTAERWLALARQEKWKELYADTVDMTFTGLRRALWRGLAPLLLRRPEIPADFVVAVKACMSHDARKRLPNITAPTLVLGGRKDRLIPEDFFRELAGLIPDARLHLLEGAGHGVIEERKSEFESSVLRFLKSL